MNKEIIIANRYKIIKKIGEGGMAKVYLAFDQLKERNVSIKILKKENIDDRKIKKFKKEARLLSLLDDENIVKIYDVGEEDNLHYIVAEYIDGMTLKDYIRSCSPIPLEEVISLSKQLLHGVKHAHERGVVHKDIKSQNILLDEDKNVKITDFGIADILDEDITRTQSLMGTPQYIAPEILNREELTAQSDLYSVGIVMYEICTAHVPFVGEKAAFIMIKQMSQPLPSIITERPDIPQSFENIVIKATAKKLSNRYKTAQEMINDLDHVLDSDRLDEEPLVLKDDILNGDAVEKTIDMGKERISLEQVNKHNNMKNNAKRKQKRIIIFSGIILLLLIAIFGLYTLKKQNITMPNLENVSESEAQNQLKILGIEEKNISIKYEYNNEIAVNNVIKTEPPKDTLITKNEPITLYVSQGAESIKLSNYVGQMIDGVKKDLEAKGIKVEVTSIDSSSKADSILSQSPGVGMYVKPGDTVNFEISKGKKEIEVPDFVNKKKQEVDDWAKQNSISITYESECNDNVADDHVISQTLEPGKKISPGDQISIVLSSGACPIQE